MICRVEVVVGWDQRGCKCKLYLDLSTSTTAVPPPTTPQALKHETTTRPSESRQPRAGTHSSSLSLSSTDRAKNNPRKDYEGGVRTPWVGCSRKGDHNRFPELRLKGEESGGCAHSSLAFDITAQSPVRIISFSQEKAKQALPSTSRRPKKSDSTTQTYVESCIRAPPTTSSACSVANGEQES
jgi:hypothetical protein